jgi:hypothetical protein
MMHADAGVIGIDLDKCVAPDRTVAGWADETYQAIRHGCEGADLHQLVERIMRAGPYRAKWDEPRGSVTWLAQDVANAIATIQKRLENSQAKYPDFQACDAPDDASDDVEATETPEQTIARLQDELAQARTLVAQQQSIIRHERAERQAAVEINRSLFAVMALPDAQMNARTKLVFMFTAREAASRNSRGLVNLPNAAIAEGTGLNEKIVSDIMQDIAARDGTPIERRITREWVADESGTPQPRSVAQVAITTDAQTYVSVLRAASVMGGPSDKAQRKKAQARERAADSLRARVEARGAGWGWCSSHDNAAVIMKGHCPECGEVTAERTMLVEEFAVLNPEMQDSGTRPAPAPVLVGTKRTGMQDSGPGSEGTQDHAMRDSGAQPIPLLDYAAARPPERPKPWRCHACNALERNDAGDRCDGCNARVLAAVSGGAE